MGGKDRKLHSCHHVGCESSFTRPYRLALHLQSSHNNVKAYACTYDNCTKSYTSKSHLDRHIKSVHKDPDNDIIFSCPTCLKKYANRQNLKRHIKINHVLKIPFLCDICKLEFKKKHQLSAHMFMHTGIKSFSCEICCKEFVSLTEKKKHLRSHKTFTCKTCLEKFNQWSKYQKHLKTEHVIKDYICNECGRSFKERAHIIRHVKLHVSKKFTCTYDNCKRFYLTKSNLRQHILIKHANLKFPCEICEKQLSTKAKLEEHVMKIHKGGSKKRNYKTKCTGRKERKDLGCPKVSMSVKLAGIIEILNNEGSSDGLELKAISPI